MSTWTTRRQLLKGAGAVAAAAAAAPVIAACQQPTTPKGSGKVVVMTDPNEFNDNDRKTLEDATKLKIEFFPGEPTPLYAMYARGMPRTGVRPQVTGVRQDSTS